MISPIKQNITKIEKKQKKNYNITYWTANHFDLCYGAKKYQNKIPKNLFDGYYIWSFPRAGLSFLGLIERNKRELINGI